MYVFIVFLLPNIIVHLSWYSCNAMHACVYIHEYTVTLFLANALLTLEVIVEL